jgi:type VI protein secretion system component VasF
MSEPQGTESLLQLAGDLRSTAPNVRAWFDHSKAAMLMERAADAIERLAHFEPDIDVEHGEN